MGCGKSKHAVATASTPTAVPRKKSSVKKSSDTEDASNNTAPMTSHDLSIGNNGNAAAVVEAGGGETGKLISRESPSRFFSSRKDVEVIAAAIGDAKSEDGDSEYGSPRAESSGRDDSLSELSATAEDGREKAAVEAAGEAEAVAAIIVVESEAPETKLQQQSDGDRKEEAGKLEGSSAEQSIGKAM